jgi:DNA-binding FadR family transcriptional regulator
VIAFAKPAAALRRDRLSDQIARDIEERIVAGELSIGDSLPSERDLMAHYGVGRPAVREALLWLNKKGLLAVSNGDRARVSEPDPKELLNLLSGAAKMLVARPQGIRLFQQTRRFVEAAIAREAAMCATDQQISRLEKLLVANEEAKSDLQAFARSDDDFHYGIAATVRNPLVSALYQAVLELLEEQRRISLSHPQALKKAMASHRKLFEAIRDRDPDRAEAEMRAHLDTVEQTYWDIRKTELKEEK